MTNINLNIDIELKINVQLTRKEYDDLVSDIKGNIESFIDLKISDLAMKHQKLLDGYELDIYINKI